MSENIENFETLLETSLKTLNTGDIVTGTVRAVGATELQVDLPAKVTGIVPFDEITDDSSVKLSSLYKVGDEITAQAVRVSDVDGIATLSLRRIARITNWQKIKDGLESGEIFTGKVTEIVKGGVIVSCNFIKVFVPAGQTGVPKTGNLEEIKGKTVNFKIIEVNDERNRAVGSISIVEREARRAKLEEFWNNIAEGATYTGTVKSLTKYGAFVDLGGIDGMVHVTELSWGRIKHPSEVVSVGDTVTVFVKSFDREKKRISLGYKTEDTNPWKLFTDKYSVGDVAEVTIVSIMPFGAFAQVIPGADGLIHISQIADKKVKDPAEELTIGQVVNAKIIAIDEEKQKISLSIRELIAPKVEETAEETAEEVVEEATEEAAE